MDSHRFDSLARTLAATGSRRAALKHLAGGAGGGLLALVGLGGAAALGQVGGAAPRIVGRPRLAADGLRLVVAWDTDRPADGAVEYGPTAAFGAVAVDPAPVPGLAHRVVLADLTPGAVVYYRVRSADAAGVAVSAPGRFRAPACPAGATACGGTCYAACPAAAPLDPVTCTCACPAGTALCGGACVDPSADPNHCGGCGAVCAADHAETVCRNGVCLLVACAAGFGDCDGDPGTGCETKLGTLDACLACGDRCDDGNACTDHRCDPAAGCVATPVADGAACGTGGVCRAGACATCAPGGVCAADRACCDDEVCCGGTCVARAALATDPANCGACGTACPATPCQTGVCAAGVCGQAPAPEGSACLPADPCVETAAAHCMAGVCMGAPKADGVACGDGKVCRAGTCAAAEPIGAAAVPDALFADDFETGTLNAWTAKVGLVVQKVEVGDGVWAARATSTGSAAYARKTLAATRTQLHAQTRFKLLTQGNNAVTLLRTLTGGASPQVAVVVSPTGKLGTLTSRDGAYVWSATAVAKNAWHALELRAKVAAGTVPGEVEVWYDGARVADLSRAANLGTTAIGAVQIGENNTQRTLDVAFDDVAVCADRCPPPVVVAPPPPVPAGTSPLPGAAAGVLLATYALNPHAGTPNWAQMGYRPRQFAAGLVVPDPTRGDQRVENAAGFAGWDLFHSPNYGIQRIQTGSNWLVLNLNRAATVGIVWRGGVTKPVWLNSWTAAGTVTAAGKTWPVFKKSVAAGALALNGVYDPGTTNTSGGRDTYWVLLAEADGLASPPPSAPAGAEAPRPNDTCPAWVHDRYTAVGPDGVAYATWHHQIDPVYWCYHRHEHGSNPAHFLPGHAPVYGYAAAKHGMAEPHPGFKNVVFDDRNGTTWLLTVHMGTAGLGRACNQFHTVGIKARSNATGQLLADLHIMGDFGKAVVNGTSKPLTPPTCPDQATLAAGSNGTRMLPSQADGPVFYEPWRIDLLKTVFGFKGSFTLNNPDPIVICNTATCDQPVQTGKSGSFRHLSVTDLVLRAGTATGEFWTDVYGRKLVSATTPGAVKQYLRPGTAIGSNLSGIGVVPGGIGCYDVDGWGQSFVCDPARQGATPTNRESSLRAPN